MGWDCLCKGKGISFPEYEWPIAVAECRAALSACTHRCTAKQDGHERAKCFTSCTADYQCSTPDAPRSSLRVHGLYDKPAGYSPPTDDADVELSIGMKFGQDLSDLDAKFKKMQASNDPNALPKSIPRLEDAENAERDSLSSKGRDTLDDNDDGQGRKLKRPNGADRLLPSDMFSMGTGLLAIHSLVALLVRQPIQ
ncbi:hypothetical protein GGI12_003068 [Dipsacomyces acuminosporus]|nr:hypothetical protein GGI12_003068 [Dipsacomyces acuminosporus]